MANHHVTSRTGGKIVAKRCISCAKSIYNLHYTSTKTFWRIGLNKSDRNKGIGLTMPITITSDINPILNCIFWMTVLCYSIDLRSNSDQHSD